jgi:hypothetical protein
VRTVRTWWQGLSTPYKVAVWVGGILVFLIVLGSIVGDQNKKPTRTQASATPAAATPAPTTTHAPATAAAPSSSPTTTPQTTTSASANGPYTELSLHHSSCDHYLSLIGDPVQPILNVENRSGHNWGQTYLWIDGNDHFHLDHLSLNNQPSYSYGAGGFYALGPLAANSIGDVHIYYRADSTGTDTIHFWIWGDDSTDRADVPNPPDTTKGLTCQYAVR